MIHERQRALYSILWLLFHRAQGLFGLRVGFTHAIYDLKEHRVVVVNGIKTGEVRRVTQSSTWGGFDHCYAAHRLLFASDCSFSVLAGALFRSVCDRSEA